MYARRQPKPARNVDLKTIVIRPSKESQAYESYKKTCKRADIKPASFNRWLSIAN